MRSTLLLAAALPLLLSCAGESADDPLPYVPPYAVLTDIDETLTTSDAEWLQQLVEYNVQRTNDTAEDDGCACDSSHGSTTPATPFLALFALAALMLARRRIR